MVEFLLFFLNIKNLQNAQKRKKSHSLFSINFKQFDHLVFFIIINPATILITAAAMNMYDPMAKPQLMSIVPLELIVSVKFPVNGDDEIADTISFTCCGKGSPPESEPAIHAHRRM